MKVEVSEDERKSRHRNTEKQRRQRINNAVNDIQRLCHCKKSDKAAILQTAVKCLKRDTTLRSQLQRMEKENEELEKQLQELKEKGAFQVSDNSDKPPLPTNNENFVDFRRIFHKNGMPMCIASLDMRVLDMNQKFADMIGYEPATMTDLAITCTQLSPVEDFHKLFELMQRLLSGQDDVGQMVKKMKTLKGTEFDVVATFMMIRDDQGQPQYVMVTSMPIAPQVDSLDAPLATMTPSIALGGDAFNPGWEPLSTLEFENAQGNVKMADSPNEASSNMSGDSESVTGFGF